MQCEVRAAQALAIAHIDKNYVLTCWMPSQIMARALLPPPLDPEQAKFVQHLLDKHKYCKEVLLSIHNASAGARNSGIIEGGRDSAKLSKALLR